MIVLRDFQLKACKELEQHDSATLVAPTGSGKTMIAAAIAWKEITKRKGRVAFVVPRDNLAKQTDATFKRWGLNAGFILGGQEENRSAKAQILSYQSLGSKKRELEWVADQTTLWIVDECHITAFSQALQPYLLGTKRKYGVTATPWQMGGKRSLLDVFDVPVFAPPPRDLIQQGYLAQPIYFRPRRKGKLDASPDFIYEQWERFSFNELTFVFCGSIEESNKTAQHFRDNGIAAVSVTSDTQKQQVEPLFEKFRRGEIRVLVSCNKLAEGCDIPHATCVILANRTESRSGAIQRIGRGARIAPGKTHFKVIDCVGTIKKFGRFEDIDLSEEDFAKSEPKEGAFPEKECPTCGASNHLAQKFCTNCGFEFEIEGSLYDTPGVLERLYTSDTEQRAIEAFHALLIRDFRHNLKNCDREFFTQYRYYPKDHWVADCLLPESMRSPVTTQAFNVFKREVAKRLPTGDVQLPLFPDQLPLFPPSV